MANFYTNDGGATWYSDSEYNNVVSIETITSGDYIVGSNLTAYGFGGAGLNIDGVNFTLTQGPVYIKGVSSVSGIILPSNIDGWIFEDLGDLSESVDFGNVTSMSNTYFLFSNLRNVDFSNVTNIEAANIFHSILTGASLPSTFSGFFAGSYFINGQYTTLDPTGNGTWNGQTYVDGVVQGGGGGGNNNGGGGGGNNNGGGGGGNNNGGGGENNYYGYYSAVRILGRTKFFGNVKFLDPMGYNS